jgi:hypothetical protein
MRRFSLARPTARYLLGHRVTSMQRGVAQ